MGLLKYFISSPLSIPSSSLIPFHKVLLTAHSQEAQLHDDSCTTDSSSTFHLHYIHKTNCLCNSYSLKGNSVYKKVPTPTARNRKGSCVCVAVLLNLFFKLWQRYCVYYSHLSQNLYVYTLENMKIRNKNLLILFLNLFGFSY